MAPQRLAEFAQHADYCKYLTFVMCRMSDQREDIRGMAGLVLKNRLRQFFEVQEPSVQHYVMREILSALGDRVNLVRATVGTVIANIAVKTGFRQWPELLQTLLHNLTSDDPILVEVRRSAFRARHMVMRLARRGERHASIVPLTGTPIRLPHGQARYHAHPGHTQHH